MSRSKNLGTEHETRIVAWLVRHGWPHAKRITLKGDADEGDIHLGDGIRVAVEAKTYFASTKSPLMLSKWMKEVEEEIENSGAKTGFAVLKRPGTTDVGQFYAVMTMERMAELLAKAGYAPPRRSIRRITRDT